MKLVRLAAVGMLVGMAVLIAPLVANASSRDHEKLGSFSITFRVYHGSDILHASSVSRGTCQINDKTYSATYSDTYDITAYNMSWRDSWNGVVPTSKGRQILSARSRLTSYWIGTHGIGIVCDGAPQPTPEGNCFYKGSSNTPAELSIRDDAGTVSAVIQGVAADQASAPSYDTVPPPCSESALRYQAFEAVVKYRASLLARMEQQHPGGFTIIRRVSVGDHARAGIKHGASHYTCGPPCSDDVGWTGEVLLTFGHPTGHRPLPGWAANGGDQHVYVAANSACTSRDYKPATLSCGGYAIAESLTYSAYGGPTAVAAGTRPAYCDPSTCHPPVPERVWLTGIVRCGGFLYYKEIITESADGGGEGESAAPARCTKS